jgi:colicin import membrane protein
MSAVLHFDEQRADPGEFASLVLAVLVHVLLALILVFGVKWQNRPPEVFQAELWEAPRPAPAPAPEPVAVEPPKPAPRVVEPVHGPPAPEPKIEKPDIVVKAPPPKPKPEVKAPPPKPEVKKPEPPKVKPKPEPVKAAPPPPRPSDAAAQQRLREELAREQMAMASSRERDQIRDMLARDASASSAKSLAGWIDKIRAKIRGNILMPDSMKGNPEAIFDVVQLPTGEVLTVKLRKSSGNAAYDAAVERAILKSSPLPRPDRPDQFRRELELKFRPHDQI